MSAPRVTFVLTLTDAAPNTAEAGPLNVRLRRALKCLLRSFALRCVRIENGPPPVEPALDAADATQEPTVGQR